MAKRDIARALRRKGIFAESIEWVQAITPEEMVPTWEIELTEADADRFGELKTQFFANTAQALEWIEGLEPYAYASQPAEGE